MTNVQETLRTRAAELLEDGTIAVFVGWEAGRFENQTTPAVCSTPEACQTLVFNEYCANNLGKYVQDLKSRGRVGLVVRGCDARAIQRMIDDNQIEREQVYLIGVGCSGMTDWRTGEPCEKCARCAHRNPHLFDEMAGEPAPEAEPALPRFSAVEAMEALPREERQELFNNAYERCLRCYACRDVCPCCTCRICFTDQRHVGWQGKQNNLNENRFFGLVRAYHIADRCIECGECERVCPMDLPLMTLNRKLVKDMNELFGAYEAGLGDGREPTLQTYDLSDLEEFM